MRRKNSPGCYCCGLDPNEQCPDKCCAEDEVWPEIDPGPSWEQVSRTVNQDCCCLTVVFNSLVNPVKECCEEAGQYSYKMYGDRNDYAFKLTADQLMLATQCAPPECPSACCQDNEPELIATWRDTLEDTFTYYFKAQFYFDVLEVRYGKEFILCPGEEEPVCRYFLKYTIFGRTSSAIITEQVLTYKRELPYLHPCWDYTPQTPSRCPTIASGIQCEFDRTPIPSCLDEEAPCASPIPECCERTTQNEIFCVQRIRYFDEPPTGSIAFTDDDVNAQPDEDPELFCDEPECNTRCAQGEIYLTEIAVSSGTPLPPKWYTHPPTKVSTTYNLLVEWDWCNNPSIGFLYRNVFAPSSCCDPQTFAGAFCDPVSCEDPPTTVTINCQDYEDPRLVWVNVSSANRLKTTWLLDPSPAGVCGSVPGAESSGPRSIFGNTLLAGPIVDYGKSITGNSIACQFPTNGPYDSIGGGCGPWDGFCITYKPANGEECDEDCYATRICDCFCQCVALFSFYGWHSSNTANFETTGTWTERECVLDNFNVTIEVSFP